MRKGYVYTSNLEDVANYYKKLNVTNIEHLKGIYGESVLRIEYEEKTEEDEDESIWFE